MSHDEAIARLNEINAEMKAILADIDRGAPYAFAPSLIMLAAMVTMNFVGFLVVSAVCGAMIVYSTVRIYRLGNRHAALFKESKGILVVQFAELERSINDPARNR